MCRFRVMPAHIGQFNRTISPPFGANGKASSLLRRMHGLLQDERGATAIEYGLIVAGISIAILATVFAIGEQLDSMFTFIGSKLMENTIS